MDKIYQTTDELWEAVINNLPEEIKANVSAFVGKAYIHIKPKSKHLGVKDFKYCVEYSKTKERAYVNVETLNGGVEGKTTIQNYIDSNSIDCVVKSIVPQQGVKNKDKWKWEVATPAAELNEELVQWYIETIVAFWNFFEDTTCSKSEPSKSQKQHICVDIEITEHEYMAFDFGDEMIGGESFVFNGDDSPGFIRITVDGKEIEFDEEALSDRSEYSDYEPFDMEEKWNSEDIVKFGYYDNLAGKTWEFDVEDFDINKLSFYYQCFDASFGPADYESEEHRITLRYDGKEVEEDLDAYSCDYGDFEQEWYMYDDED